MTLNLNRFISESCDPNDFALVIEYTDFMLNELKLGTCRKSLFINNRQNLLLSLNRIFRDNKIPEIFDLIEAITKLEKLMLLNKGMQNIRVIALKNALFMMGYLERPFSDTFDHQTEISVKNYQQINELDVTGVADIELIRHLYWHAKNYISQINLEDIATITGGKFIPANQQKLTYLLRIQRGEDRTNFRTGDLVLTKNDKLTENQETYLRCLDSEECAGLITDAVIEKSHYGITPLILVNSIRSAMFRLAKHARDNFDGSVIAVTGSSGKTTVKEMLRHILSKQANTVANFGSANSLWAICSGILNFPSHSSFYIFESGLGANGSSIAHHSEVLKPHVAVITSVSLAHAAGYSDLEEIARRKSEIFKALQSDGFAVIDRDSICYQVILEEAKQQGVKNFFSFGWHSCSDARLISIDVNETGTETKAILNGSVVTFKLPMIGRHWGKMGLAALSCCYLVGAEINQAIQDLKTLPVVSGRGELIKIMVNTGPIHFFDSHYNANPGSMKADLEAFEELMRFKHNRKIGIIGEMKELGNYSEISHSELAIPISKINFFNLILIGKAVIPLAKALEGKVPYQLFENVNESFSAIENLAQEGDFIFLKGSRGNELEKVIQFLKQKELNLMGEN